MEEFGGFALEGVADELESPSEQEQEGGVGPEAVQEDASYEQGYRDENCRDAEGVAGSVDGVLVAGGVLGDPLFVGAVAHHGREIIHPGWRPAQRLKPVLLGMLTAPPRLRSGQAAEAVP